MTCAASSLFFRGYHVRFLRQPKPNLRHLQQSRAVFLLLRDASHQHALLGEVPITL